MGCPGRVTGGRSDRWGRKPFIVGGILLRAAALALFAGAFTGWAVAAALLGAGTAMVSRDHRRPGRAPRLG